MASVAESRVGRNGYGARQFLELWFAFVVRDLRTRYRGSYLGWLWSLARPLALLLVYGLVIGVFLGAAQRVPEFMIFVFTGIIAWQLFSSIVTGSIASLRGSASLIKKQRFPTAVIPLSVATVALFDAVIQACVLVVGYVIVRDAPSLGSLVYLLPSLLSALLLGLSLGMVLSAIGIYVRDVGFLTDVALMIGFWLCPIVYSFGFVSEAALSMGWSVEWVTRLYMLNPMANVVVGFQRALWPPGSTPEGALLSFPGQLELRLLILVAFCTALAVFSFWIFRRLSRQFGAVL